MYLTHHRIEAAPLLGLNLVFVVALSPLVALMALVPNRTEINETHFPP